VTTYPQIDYTTRDFLSLVHDMTALIQDRVPEWTDRSQNDFGMVLIELFAYCGDILSYYGDRIANEAFLPTATQRESVLAIAKLLDYYPSGPVAASVGLTFTNTSKSYVWVLNGTQVATKTVRPSTPHPPGWVTAQTGQIAVQAPVVFETVEDVLVPPNGAVMVTAVEGVTYNEQVGVSSAAADQDFPLYRLPVIDNSVSVTVGTTKWVHYERLVDAYPTTRAYVLETDGNNAMHIIFGDNANGAIPPIGQPINVTYRVGTGKRGNVAAGAISQILGTMPSGIHVTNAKASGGGGDGETIAQIKANAPRSLFTMQRAVTATDYVGLALRVGGVAKASVEPALSCSNVTMYIAPVGGGGLDDLFQPTPAFTLLKNRVWSYLSDKVPIGTNLTIADPTYVAVKLLIDLVVKPKYRREATRQAAIKAVLTLFSFDAVVFGDTITLKDVHTALSTVAGIDKVTIREVGRNTPRTIDVDPMESAPLRYRLDVRPRHQGPRQRQHRIGEARRHRHRAPGLRSHRPLRLRLPLAPGQLQRVRSR
jgi:hypothetical protein